MQKEILDQLVDPVNYHYFFKWAAKIIPDEQTAEDLVHDAYIKILQHQNIRKETLKTFITTIIYNDAITLQRKQKRAKNVPIDLDCIPAKKEPDKTQYHELRDITEEALQHLQKRQAQIFRAAILDELSYEQIMENYHICRETIRPALHHARKKIQQHLHSYVENK